MMTFDAFISYATKDKTVADAACAALESAGIRCWIAPRDIVPGSDWGASIVEALDQCRVMVLIFSSNANQSIQIRNEIVQVVNRGIPVVPIRIEDVTPTKALAYFMGAVHWLDALTPPVEKHLQRLAESIKVLLQINLQAPAAEAKTASAAPVSPPKSPGIQTLTTAAEFIRRGGAYFDRNEYDLAILDYTEALKLDPHNAKAFGGRGAAFCEKADYPRALADLNEAVRLEPNAATTLYNRGSVISRMGDRDAAIKDFDESIRLNPKRDHVFLGRGNAYYAKADYDRAIADYDEAIRLNPKYLSALAARANAYNSKGEEDRAIQCYDEVIRMNPKYMLAFYNRGIAYSAKGEYDRAIQDYDEAIRLSPNNADALYKRGLAKRKLSDYEGANADIAAAKLIDPNVGLT